MTEPETSTQPELDLEFPTPTDYTVTVSKGAVGDLQTLRSHRAKTDEDAMNLIEGLRGTFANRDEVTWRDEEMPANGAMYGLAPHGIVYEISVVPQLGTLS